MTSWSCAACTYLNHIDPVGGSDDTNDDCDHNTPRYCEICQTPRETKEEEVDRGQGGAERRRQRGTGGKEEDANSYAAVVASSSASTADPAEDESSLLSQAGIFYSDDSDKISKSKNNSVNRKEKKRKKDSSALVQMTLMGTRASVDPPDGSSATAASMKKKKMRRIGNDQQKQYHPRPRPLHEELEENPPTAKTIAFSSAPVGGGSSSSSSSPSLLETEEKRIQRVMERVFGIQKLRPLQSEVVRQILTGRGGSRDRSFASLSTSLRANEPQNNHQIVVMATGAGKSICYQLPALVMSEEKKKKTCLVISPLVALMEDQVRSLQLRGVEADMMASNKSAEHNRHVLDRLLLVGSTKDLGTASVAATAAKSAVVASATAKGKKTSHHNHKPLALLYCTPEQIRRPYFRSLLLEMHRRRCISLLAIDEAHCISTWGHDFRPSYRELQWLSHNLRGVPLLACTATATPRVLQDIQEGLGMMPSNGECVIRVGNLDRVNLFYRVTYVDALLRHAAVAANAGAAGTVLAATGLRGRGGEESDDSPLPPSHRTVVQVETDPQRAHLLAHLRKMHTQFHVQNLPCAGIVYCRKREQVVELANFINRAFLSPSTASEDRRGDSSSSCSFVRVRATSYHGGMSAADRADAQEGWTKGRYHVVVATSAFGMGIDVAHVRYVVHWSLPQSIEAFYQESGRAGRDGEPAHSLLYASHDDIRTLRYIVSQQEDRRRAKQQEEQQQKQQEQLLLHQKKITALEKMIEYAMTPHCRRRYLLRHFGVEDLERGRGSGRGGIDENNADGNGSNQCQARCDYCSRPDRVRRAVERSATAAAMQQSYNPFRVGSGRGYQRDDSGRIGRWGQRDAGADEHNDRDEDKREPDWDRPETEKRTRAGGLRITSSASDDGYDDETLAEAAQAATIGKQGDSHVRATLEKYEAIELQQNQKSGFVHFKQRVDMSLAKPKASSTAPSCTYFKVPEHFRAKIVPVHKLREACSQSAGEASAVPQPPLPPGSMSAEPLSSSTPSTTEADRLRAELEELRARKAACRSRRDALAIVLAGASGGSPKPP